MVYMKDEIKRILINAFNSEAINQIAEKVSPSGYNKEFLKQAFKEEILEKAEKFARNLNDDVVFRVEFIARENEYEEN